MDKYRNLIDAVVAICTLFQFSQRCTAALKVYGEKYGNKSVDNIFLDTSQKAIWRQLLSELSKIYDKEMTGKYDNCSLGKIKSLYIEAKGPLYSEKSDNIINRIDELQGRYENLLTKELRNKKLAHYDLTLVYSRVVPCIKFIEIEHLVNDTSDVLKNICDQYYLDGLVLEYDRLVELYNSSLSMVERKEDY